MWITRDRSKSTLAVFCLGMSLMASCNSAASDPDPDEIIRLGQALFFDTNLSANRSQACATCHDPEHAFSDSRDNGVSGAVSLGDDGISLGDRNTPSATYASSIPDFHTNEAGEFVGGYFLDGRAATMVEQAGMPFINPIEMGMPDAAAVVDRVSENPYYVTALKKHFGEAIFTDPKQAILAISQSIVAFEKTDLFAPFDSKYDRFLRGEYQMTDEENLGRILYFSDQVNCSSCHLLNTLDISGNETFTNHRYHNIGIPSNTRARQANGVDVSHQDLGLLENPAVSDPAQAGKFRVPSLRNVAVTGPYMHNGVFQELSTAILFYGKFTLGDRQSQTNPETGELWGEAEVAETTSLELLREGQPINADRAKSLAAFLTTLTDQRYEPLLVH